MKKLYTSSIILIPAFLILLAFTAGPPAGNTGSPLDGQDCSACHTPLPAGHVLNWISSSIPAAGYTPGETYTVSVSALTIVAVKMGFQITSETLNNKAGTFIITDDARTKLTNAYTVTHTAAGTAVTGLPNTWTMNWMAPEMGTGPITFYAAVNETNNDNSNNGDLIYLSTLIVDEFSVGIAETADHKGILIYPNPAGTYINIEANLQAEIKIIDNSGRLVRHLTSYDRNMNIDIEGLNAGIYYVHIYDNGEVSTSKFIKK